MEIQFISSFAPIVADPSTATKLYTETFGLPLEAAEGTQYFHSESVEGTKHFGVWPLAEAAEACFGTREWPEDRAVPQASVEFEVASAELVESAAEELAAAGHEPLHPARTEPWGQTVARMQSADGLIVGVSYAPWMH